MSGILMEKRSNGLKPIDQDGIDALAKVKNGKILLVQARGTRNPKQHRLFWKLMDIIHEHQDRYATREQVSDAIKIAVGYYDELPLVNGQMTKIPKSISYGSMTQEEFTQFFDKVIELTARDIIPNISEKALRDELERMIGGTY